MNLRERDWERWKRWRRRSSRWMQSAQSQMHCWSTRPRIVNVPSMTVHRQRNLSLQATAPIDQKRSLEKEMETATGESNHQTPPLDLQQIPAAIYTEEERRRQGNRWRKERANSFHGFSSSSSSACSSPLTFPAGFPFLFPTSLYLTLCFLSFSAVNFSQS